MEREGEDGEMGREEGPGERVRGGMRRQGREGGVCVCVSGH